MKISYGISKDSKGTPRARRFMQCYVLRIARANIQCLVSLASESVIMAHGVADALTATEEENCVKMVSKQPSSVRKTVGVMGSRRIFAPAFKLKVLDSYRNDIDCRGNQRATARKYGIHRRQIQKWLQCEDNLRSSCVESGLGSGSGHAHARSTSATDSPIPVTGTIGNSEAPNAEGLRDPTAAPVPALNLSRARLHGDEELSPPAPQQGPPLQQHCPASPRYSPQPPMPQNGNPLSLSTTMHPPTGLNHEQPHHHHHQHQQHHHGHLHHQQQQQQPQQQQHHSQQHKESQQQQQQQPQQQQQQEEQRFSTGISQSEYTSTRRSGNVSDLEASLHRHGILATEDQVTSYYLPTTSYDIELARCDGSTEVKLYSEPLPSTYDDVPTTSQRYARSNRHENFSAVSATRQDIGSRISSAATIKSEPDAVATAATTAPGPCDALESTSGRPSSRCERVSPLPPHGLSPPHRATTAAVHFERLRASPLRTQAGNGAQPGENSGNVHKDGSGTAVLRRQTTARSSAYPQTHPQAHPQMQPQSLTQTHARSMDEAEYVADLVQPPASARSTTLPQCFLPPLATSPPVERVLYSSGPPPPPSPPSPQCSRGALSSGLSTTSSDSETDALDYSTTTLTPSNDLARRRSFSLRFKLDVLNAFHRDVGVAGNQRATARKFGINRRQVQKWLSQETELRGEIALRGGVSRQRLGPLSSGDSPIDLRTNPPTPADSLQDTAIASQRVSQDAASSADSYCCYSPETVSPHHGQSFLAVSPESAEILSPTSSGRACNLSCCADNGSCYSQESLRITESSGCPKRNNSCYAAESHAVFACFSIYDGHQSVENSVAPQQRDRSLPSCYDSGKYVERARLPTSSPLKRSCPPSCCSYAISPKRPRTHHDDIASLRQPCCEEQPQDVPLCLVKSKGTLEPACQPEPVTSTVPTPPAVSAAASLSLPPAVTSTKQDAILFKPYLDNPIAKPLHDSQILPNGSANHHNSHPHHKNSNNNNSNLANNNNNCQNARNLNSHVIGSRTNNDSYALEFSLSVPISWAASLGPYSDISQVGSAFVRYPTTLPYT